MRAPPGNEKCEMFRGQDGTNGNWKKARTEHFRGLVQVSNAPVGDPIVWWERRARHRLRGGASTVWGIVDDVCHGGGAGLRVSCARTNPSLHSSYPLNRMPLHPTTHAGLWTKMQGICNLDAKGVGVLQKLSFHVLPTANRTASWTFSVQLLPEQSCLL